MIVGRLNSLSATDYLKLGVSVVVFGYCLWRAYALSMTHAESIAVVELAARSIWSLFGNTPPDTNNHLLNTLLIKLLVFIKNSPFWVRLPNVLALLAYLYFAARLTALIFKQKDSEFVAFLLIVLNPYLLDFFSLGLGLGLSVGLMMGSMYYLAAFWQQPQQNMLRYTLLFAMLAALSHLTQLSYYLALILLLPGIAYYKTGKISWPQLKTLSFSFLMLGALVYLPVSNLLAHGALYYSGKSGFIEDAFLSLINCSMYNQFYFGPNTSSGIGYMLLGLVVLSVAVGVWQAIRQQEITTYILWIMVPLLVAAGNIVQALLFDTGYPANRTALLYWPLYALLLALLLDNIHYLMRLLVGVAFVYHCYWAANLNYFRDWWYDRHTEDMINYVMARHHKEDTICLGARGIFRASINYYKQARAYPNLYGPTGEQKVDNSQEYDYIFVEGQDLNKVHASYVVEKEFGSGYFLMVRKQVKNNTAANQ